MQDQFLLTLSESCVCCQHGVYWWCRFETPRNRDMHVIFSHPRHSSVRRGGREGLREDGSQVFHVRHYPFPTAIDAIALQSSRYIFVFRAILSSFRVEWQPGCLKNRYLKPNLQRKRRTRRITRARRLSSFTTRCIVVTACAVERTQCDRGVSWFVFFVMYVHIF